jgi:predicted RNase H-like nuclease (RuvC/YqgF family)
LRKACGEAVEELKAARKLIVAQRGELEVQRRVIELQERIEAGLKNWQSLSEREKDELRKALAAKDRVIDALERKVEVLEKRQWSVGKIVTVVIVSAAVGVAVGAVIANQ